jgi:hypothetical protein
VERIYRDFLSGMGIFAIAEGLTRDGIPSPSAYDPGRNGHRNTKAWSKSAIRVILTNARYTGRQVWNKQHKTETLIDVDDVALGHETKMRWNPKETWISSSRTVHKALVDEETFGQVQALIAAGARRSRVERKPRQSKRGYQLSGLLFCALCGRRMQGSFNNGRNHYRCGYAAEYADANRIAHPRSLYVREDKIIELLDPWIARAFSPDNLRTTVDAIVAAQIDEGNQHRIAQSRDILATCDDKLKRYRAALEAGTDPGLVQQWIAEVQAERTSTERALQRLTTRRPMIAAELQELIDGLSGIAQILRRASAEDKANLYKQLGLRLRYEPGLRLIKAEAEPNGSCTKVCPRGNTNQYPDWPDPRNCT